MIRFKLIPEKLVGVPDFHDYSVTPQRHPKAV